MPVDTDALCARLDLRILSNSYSMELAVGAQLNPIFLDEE